MITLKHQHALESSMEALGGIIYSMRGVGNECEAVRSDLLRAIREFEHGKEMTEELLRVAAR